MNLTAVCSVPNENRLAKQRTLLAFFKNQTCSSGKVIINRITHTSENITFPPTSFVVGKVLWVI